MVLAALLPGMDLASPADLLRRESRRVALASVLIGEHDLLLLDEPTNHLDVEAIDWLAQRLAGRPEALVAVTHDRWFLDAVCNRTWELADGQLHAYEGGYSAYVLAGGTEPGRRGHPPSAAQGTGLAAPGAARADRRAPAPDRRGQRAPSRTSRPRGTGWS